MITKEKVKNAQSVWGEGVVEIKKIIDPKKVYSFEAKGVLIK